MKLLIFCPHYPPYVGGLETHAAEFNKYMAQKEEVDSIVVFTSRIPSSTPLLQTEKKITIIRFPAYHIVPNHPMPKFWVLLFWRQWWQLYRMKVDLVVSRTRFTFTSLMALIIAKTRRKPWVHIEHGSDYPQLTSRFVSWIAYLYDRTIGWTIFHFSTQNVAIARAVKLFIAKFDRRPVPVIYRGVETKLIESIKPDLGLRKQFNGKIILIFVGRLIDGKGVADLVNAIAKLKNKNLIGIIVGDGPQRSNLEELVDSLALGDQVYFKGQQPLPKALAMVKSSDIFVNPSYTEGLPSSVIEAALCRRCIIATDVGGTREIITHKKSGFLIPPHDVDNLVRCLDDCLSRPELRGKMGEQAYVQAKRRFSWPRSCDTYSDIFHAVTRLYYKKHS